MRSEAVDDLIRRVEDFQIDAKNPQLTFADRLSRENGWTKSHAIRVIHEYKRFAILAMTAGHPVSPSGDVDQAWHLHLTYTRSYWNHFCREVLRAELHHAPTTGGPEEFAKHYRQYIQTLESYKHLFGEHPPADIWPEPVKEFQGSGHKRWVDSSRYWLFPRFRFLRIQFFLGVMSILATLGCGAAEFNNVNPFQLDGPQFLIFYSLLFFVAAAFSLYFHWYYPRNQRNVSVENLAEDLYLVSALAHGPSGVIRAALAKLVKEKHLLIEEQKAPVQPWYLTVKTPPVKVRRGKPLPSDRPEIETILYQTADGTLNLKEVVEAAIPAAKISSERLRELELADPVEEGWFPRKLPALVLAVLAVLGIVRLIIGISRGKPITILLILTFLCVGLLIMIWYVRRKLTPLGSTTRKALLDHFEDLENKIKYRPSHSTGDIALAAGLFGIVTTQQYPELQILDDAMKREKVFAHNELAGHTSGCDSGCGGGGGGGGCGGGCGGCGGD